MNGLDLHCKEVKHCLSPKEILQDHLFFDFTLGSLFLAYGAAYPKKEYPTHRLTSLLM